MKKNKRNLVLKMVLISSLFLISSSLKVTSQNLIVGIVCCNTLILDTIINVAPQVYYSAGTITAPDTAMSPVMIIGNSSVDFKAAQYIHLKCGFSVTHTSGCGIFHAYTGTQPNNCPTPIITGDHSFCDGSFANLSAATSISDSGVITSYQWQLNNHKIPGATNLTYQTSTAGNYTLVITNSNNCTVISQVFTIDMYPSVIIIDSIINIVSCGGAMDGTATAIVIGGTPPYSYVWSNGSTNATVSGLSAGTYYTSVTDANGCSSSSSITMTEAPVLIISTLVTDNVCFDETNGTASVSVSDGIPPYSYSWSNGAASSFVAGLAAGTYYFTVTDANGCTSSSSVVIAQPTALLTTLTTMNVSCFGGSNGSATVVSIDGGTPPYSGSGTINGLSAGNYSHTITDANGCTLSVSVVITEPSKLVVDVTATNVNCSSIPDGMAIVTASGGSFPYSGTGTFTGLAAGNYMYTVTDANGCTRTGNVTLYQSPMPAITIAGSQASICSGDSMLLMATSINDPNYDYVWSPALGLNMTNGSIVTANPATTTTYTVTGTDLNVSGGCNTSTITVIVDNCNTASVLNLTCFIQGYWNGINGMQAVLANQSEPTTIDACDSIDVELHDVNSPYGALASTRPVLNQNGTAICNFTSVSGDYYIVIKHRNAIETWSAYPVFISSLANFNFSTAASQAYGNNQVEVSPGVWAFYNGDVNQDENVDLLDLGQTESDINNFALGYMTTDLNGDGNVDLLDGPIVENNINNFIFSSHP